MSNTPLLCFSLLEERRSSTCEITPEEDENGVIAVTTCEFLKTSIYQVSLMLVKTTKASFQKEKTQMYNIVYQKRINKML